MYREAFTVENRVDRGIAWLDKRGPAEWWNRVDLDVLAIDDSDVCVLGQVFMPEAHESGMVNGYAYAVMFKELIDDVVGNGFCETDNEDARELADLWVSEIINRRALVNA